MKNKYIHSMNIGTIPGFITGKKLDIWDNSLNLMHLTYNRFILLSNTFIFVFNLYFFR